MHRNADSALKLGQARGAAICAVFAASPAVFEYAPREVKLAIVGQGGAQKDQVQLMVLTAAETARASWVRMRPTRSAWRCATPIRVRPGMRWPRLPAEGRSLIGFLRGASPPSIRRCC